MNSEKTLNQTLQSSAEQSCIYEHIFVDGGSTDQTLRILDTYVKTKPNARVIKQLSKGLYGALNDGVKNAKGDYVWFLHSDDYFASKSVISAYLDAMKSHAPGLVYSDVKFVNDRGRQIRRWVSGSYSKTKCFFGWMPPHVTCLTRRDLFESVGYFSESHETAADYEWLLRILWDRDVPILHVPIVSIVMRAGGASDRSIRSRIRANWLDGKSWRTRVGPLFIVPQIFKPLRKISQLDSFRFQR